MGNLKDPTFLDSCQVAFLKFIVGLREVSGWARDQEGLGKIVARRTIVGNPSVEVRAIDVVLIYHQLVVPGCSFGCKSDCTFMPEDPEEAANFRLCHGCYHHCRTMKEPSFAVARASFVVAKRELTIA